MLGIDIDDDIKKMIWTLTNEYIKIYPQDYDN